MAQQSSPDSPQVSPHTITDGHLSPTDEIRRTSTNGSSTSATSSPYLDGQIPSSSSPGFRPSLSRNGSFMTSYSFADDWEAFPPLDKLTVFDFLDNLALPQRLERLQSTFNAQTEKVRRQSEKFKHQSAKAKERVREEWRRRVPPTAEEQVEKYRRKMSESVDRLGKRWDATKTVTLREKTAFTMGVLNIAISFYLIGAWPEYFHLWYTVQLCYFMPLRYYTYHQKGMNYFLADLCYAVNILAALSIWAFPQSRRLFVATYCLAMGNNGWAIMFWRNSLVFHSLDKVTSLFIHLMPPAMLHCITHLISPGLRAARFPGAHAVHESSSYSTLISMLLWSSLPYAIWQITYHLMITVRRRAKIEAGRPTSFTWLRRSYASTWIGKAVLALPEKLQEPAFMGIQYCYAVLTMLPCPIWLKYRWASAGFLIFVFTWSVQNGATYYIDVFGKRFEKELAKMKAEMDEWKRDPERMMAQNGSSPVLAPTQGITAGRQADGRSSVPPTSVHMKKDSRDQIASLDGKLNGSVPDRGPSPGQSSGIDGSRTERADLKPRPESKR